MLDELTCVTIVEFFDASLGNSGGNFDLYAFVDGVLKASTNITTPNTAVPFNISLDQSDRFLTLITSSNGGYGSDWAFFGDPQLALITTPEPASLAVWLLLGAIGLGYAGYRRLRTRN